MNQAQDLSTGGTLIVAAFGLLVLGVLVGSLTCWVLAFIHHNRVLGWSGWKAAAPKVVVGLIDIAGCILCVLMTQVLIFAVLKAGGVDLRLDSPKVNQESSSTPTAAIVDRPGLMTSTDAASVEQNQIKSTKTNPWLMVVSSVGLLVAGIITAMLVILRTGCRPRDIGLTLRQFQSDVVLGVTVFLLATPLLLILNLIVTAATKTQYEHPVIDAMREHPWAYPGLFFGAVICAPLWEEFAFRGLLVAWFHTMIASRWNWVSILVGRPAGSTGVKPELTRSDSLSDVASRWMSDDGANPYAPSFGSSLVERGRLRSDNALAPGQANRSEPGGGELVEIPWWPALLSGAIFGLAHFDYGVSWMPLMVLGIVLGRVYQLRQSIVPCVVVHALFNGFSMLGLGAQLLTQK